MHPAFAETADDIYSEDKIMKRALDRNLEVDKVIERARADQMFDESNICTVLDELIKVDTKAAQVEVMKLDSLYKELRAKKKAREDVKDVEKQIEEEAVLYRRVEAQKERLNSRKGGTCGGSFFYSG